MEEYVIIATGLNGYISVFRFGENRTWAERCYQSFEGEAVTLYKVVIKLGDDIGLQPIKTRKEEK